MSVPVSKASLALLACVLLGAATARADPWLAPGDEGLRSDIQRLADAGVLRGPVTTWPLSWPDIARDVNAQSGAGLDDATAAALVRVQRQARAAANFGFAGTGIRVSGAHEPARFRSFAGTPREEGEIGLRAGFLGDRVALNLEGTFVADADDGKQARLDGSYLGVNIGNFMFSAGFMDRWWGPGWDGSLILSTNARPIPSFTIERNYTDPFKSRLLSWIGPWRASIAVGEAEDHDVAVPGVRFLAARVNFKPRPWLEFGLTRTAQWCGGGRDCGWDTFSRLVLGRDNRGDGLAADDEPGNQMAGYDMRLRSPWRRLPLALYTQWIGEDEAGGLPSKFMGQAGIETWGSSSFGGWRFRGEFSDTTCSFTRETPQFECGYRNGLYPQGYAYRGRVIGHAMDNDSRMYSVGGILTRENGDQFSLTVKRVELNRDGGIHAISAIPVDVDDVELRARRDVRLGRISAGLGYETGGETLGSGSGLRAFLSWQQGY
jgi:hypothetical protein